VEELAGPGGGSHLVLEQTGRGGPESRLPGSGFLAATFDAAARSQVADQTRQEGDGGSGGGSDGVAGLGRRLEPSCSTGVDSDSVAAPLADSVAAAARSPHAVLARNAGGSSGSGNGNGGSCRGDGGSGGGGEGVGAGGSGDCGGGGLGRDSVGGGEMRWGSAASSVSVDVGYSGPVSFSPIDEAHSPVSRRAHAVVSSAAPAPNISLPPE
jgi:hypothetical protein